MKTAKRFYYMGSWTEAEVIGIGKLYLAANLLEIACRKAALYGSLSSYVHKYGRLRSAMRRCELASARITVCA